jgi:hypothetical protein
MESVDSTDDVLTALVAKWLGAEPEVDVERLQACAVSFDGLCVQAAGAVFGGPQRAQLLRGCEGSDSS